MDTTTCCCCGLRLAVQIAGELDILCGLLEVYIALVGYFVPDRLHPAPAVRLLTGAVLIIAGALTIRGSLAARTPDGKKAAVVKATVRAQQVVFAAAVLEHLYLITLLHRKRPDFLVEVTQGILAVGIVFISAFNCWSISTARGLYTQFEASARVPASSAASSSSPVPSLAVKVGKSTDPVE